MLGRQVGHHPAAEALTEVDEALRRPRPRQEVPRGAHVKVEPGLGRRTGVAAVPAIVHQQHGQSAGDQGAGERHPAGEEVVLLLSGRVDLIQRVDGGERRVALGPGQAVVK